MQSQPKPKLYAANAEGRIMLKGVRCSCGRTAFPYQSFGCERCGRSETLEPTGFEAIGTLAASTRVHLHGGAAPKAPFVIGAIKLDAGPMIRTFLADVDLRPGQRVSGTLARVAGEAGDTVDLVFDLAPSDDAAR